MENNNIEKIEVAVADLKRHPYHHVVYGNSDVSALEAAIRRQGVLDNIIVDTDKVVLKGWRCVEAIRNLGWETIVVTVLDIPLAQQPVFMVRTNSQRKKTPYIIYKEVQVLKPSWLKKPGTRTDLQIGMSEEMKQQTRKRLAKAVGVPESTLHKIETVGDFDADLLLLIEEGTDRNLFAIYQAVSIVKKSPPEVEEIPLNDVKDCSCCGSRPIRIVESGQTLVFNKVV